MIKHIKKDFNRVRLGLDCVLNRKVPLGIFILYYVVAGLIVLPFWPFVWLYYKITLEIYFRKYKDEA